MNFTPIAKPYLSCRVKQISKYAYSTERIQREVLKRLIGTASATEWGIRHSYSAIANYEQFAQSVAVQDYESLKGYIDRMRHGEKACQRQKNGKKTLHTITSDDITQENGKSIRAKPDKR